MADFMYPQDDTVTASDGPTPSQTVGPFFHDALPFATGPRVAGPDRRGAVLLTGQVLDGDGLPITDALVEIWHADERGRFVDEPGIYHEVTGDGFRGFGRSATDGEGRYAFVTVKPGPVPTVDGTAQAPHIAMSIFARGMLRRVVTRVYFPEEADANSTDPLRTSLSDARRQTLLADAIEGGYRFDVRIQGADETVFLDVFAR